MHTIDRSAWRLLPSEEPLWLGAPARRVAPDVRWIVVPALLLAAAVVFGSFGGLLSVTEVPGARQTFALASLLGLMAVLVWWWPRLANDGCQYLVTDLRVLWRRGRLMRTMERSGIHYSRIRWHRNAPGVGHLDLVRAVPFGPLARQQHLTLRDVRAPDALLALLRHAHEPAAAGDARVPLTERLDTGEEVLWGGHPQGWMIGWREAGVALLGGIAMAVGLRYGVVTGGILLSLEHIGLDVGSWTWVFFFVATMTSGLVICAVGAALIWHGLWRAHVLGRETEYLLTDRRLLIRRGRTELSVDRRRIVDVAATPVSGGLHHLFLVLDAPGSRALALHGALGAIAPARDAVPPVLYELRDFEPLRQLILERSSRPVLPPVRDAA